MNTSFDDDDIEKMADNQEVDIYIERDIPESIWSEVSTIIKILNLPNKWIYRPTIYKLTGGRPVFYYMFGGRSNCYFEINILYVKFYYDDMQIEIKIKTDDFNIQDFLKKTRHAINSSNLWSYADYANSIVDIIEKCSNEYIYRVDGEKYNQAKRIFEN